MTTTSSPQGREVYEGQFGKFTIELEDRREVIIYRLGLTVSAVSFALGSGLLLWQGPTPLITSLLTFLFASFAAGLGVSLLTIHIYLRPLHRMLQFFWLVGTATGVALAIQHNTPLAVYVYNHPVTIWGVGFLFAALTGIFFKEAFCFNRLETKVLTPLVPILLLGHLSSALPLNAEKILLAVWSGCYLIFAIRKLLQPIPPDIGDKSVFTYLKQQRSNT